MNRTCKERLEKQLKEAQELFEQCKKETIREIENITTRNTSDFGATYFTHIDRITLAGQKVQTLEQVLKILDDYPYCHCGAKMQEGKQMTTAELKAKKLISERTTEQLVSDFELTDKINDVNISTVRGWIMDELEKRDSVAFDKWIDAYTDSPREFFLG